MKTLTKLSIENLLHPFQTFIIGQKNIAPKIALNFNIPLIFYGENQAEYGNPIVDNSTSLMKKSPNSTLLFVTSPALSVSNFQLLSLS